MLVAHRQQGMTLVEMLVSLVAGLLVVAGALSLFSSVIVAGNTTLMLSRLNQDVQSVTDIMVRDIQRAGYHPSAAQGMDGDASAAIAAEAMVFSMADDLYASSGASAPNCIRIKYWDDGDVVQAYRYDAADRELQCRSTSSAGKCDASNDKATDISTLCNAGSNWPRFLAEDEISIDDLRFELVSGGSATGMRTIRLTLSASHVDRPALSVSLQREIKLRNDGY
ncbi:prepilin-type N-terminal cleavage/methylation domain-containing protein [Oceanimonas pelagia]|uniref:Prepilin-type N-terminal cleavage/methylation domain-containing protein n=1 Tax=Oceanimonas pelagia TaxID=3028314 RepID=A0AA50Q715_9GAMM|nr:prepilin-type N-terminal cleavage/methylation domain-containing protein [Oceanimonas pelagia]WMC10030.1 prepilin-type N-terminal cleavage/methylation domain-containing protein [Oceanimonas pelagia]